MNWMRGVVTRIRPMPKKKCIEVTVDAQDGRLYRCQVNPIWNRWLYPCVDVEFEPTPDGKKVLRFNGIPPGVGYEEARRNSLKNKKAISPLW